MPDFPITLEEPVTTMDFSFRNGEELSVVIQNEVDYSLHTTLKHLPGFSSILGIDTTGEELGRLFSQHTDLPGVILFDENRFVGVISQTHYYKCISRAFGREIYYRRPSAIMLEDITVPTLILSSDCTIQTAVEKCINRPSDYVYEPFLIHDQESGQYRLCAFQILLLASSQLAALRNRQMEQILNSVTDGLLVIDRNFRIGREYSKMVGKIFERTDLHEVTLPDVLQPLIDTVTHEQLQDYLKILFDPKLIDRLIKSINPAKQISALFPSLDSPQEGRVKHFALNFERIRTQAEISQVLVRIEDITQRMNLAKELEQQEAAAEEKLQLVMQILQIEPTALNRFLSRFDDALSAIEKALEPSHDNLDLHETIHSLFRQAHTLKGEASLLGLISHERALHQLEDRLEKLRSSSQLEINALATLGHSWETLQKLNDQIRQALDQLKHLGNTKIQMPVHSPETITPAGLIETLSRLISELSKRLGKPVTFHTTVTNDDLPSSYSEVLREILVHLARNSMVHGIESAEDRIARGKNSAGLIQLELKSHSGFHEIIFQDDGNGLDCGKIRQRAEQMGWNPATKDELHHAIFEPGFSTAGKVTDLAGRGVGLDIIRTSLEKVGGHIIPHSEQGAYCAFQILLPIISPQHVA